MSLIEGVGDEVTVFFVFLTLLCVIAIAWFSTNIRDIPFVSLIIIELSHRRNHNQENLNENLNTNTETLTTAVDSTETTTSYSEVSDSTQDNSSESGEKQTNTLVNSEIVSEESTVTRQTEGDININEDNATQPTTEAVETDITEVKSFDSPEITQVSADSNLSETELRKRRVAFFENKTVDTFDDGAGHNDSKCHGDHLDCSKSVNDTSDHMGLCQSAKTEEKIFKKDANVEKDTSKPENESSNQERDSISNSSQSALSGDQVPSTETQSEIDESQIRIRLKYLNDSQRQVTADPQQTIGQFRRDNFASELENNKLVRFIFNGQDLRNDANTLQAYNIVDNSVVHCLITQVDRRVNQSARQETDHDGFDIGNLMLPVFGFIICVVWYLRFEYRQFFSGTSTISLIGITFLYIAAILASWENHRRGHAHEHVE